MRFLPLLALVALVACTRQAPEKAAAPPASDSFTLAITADNRGQLAVCGCKLNPSGGFARRALFLDDLRKKGPVVVVDGGDALFEKNFARSDAEKEAAALILEAMGEVGTQAMGVGERDLVLGVEWLKSTAKKAGVPLVAANLVLPDGSKPFEPSVVVEAGGRKVGVIGVSEMVSGSPDGIASTGSAEAVKAEVAKLRSEGVSFVVVLGHGSKNAMGNLALLEGVDFVIPSHGGSIAGPHQARPDTGWVLGASSRGRNVLVVEVHDEGEGTLRDDSLADRLRKERALVERRLERAQLKLAAVEAASPEKTKIADSVEDLQKRLQEVKELHVAAEAEQGKGRRFTSRLEPLSDTLPAEPRLDKRIEAFLAEHPEARPTIF